jgi:hypothetical protein
MLNRIAFALALALPFAAVAEPPSPELRAVITMRDAALTQQQETLAAAYQMQDQVKALTAQVADLQKQLAELKK